MIFSLLLPLLPLKPESMEDYPRSGTLPLIEIHDPKASMGWSPIHLNDVLVCADLNALWKPKTKDPSARFAFSSPTGRIYYPITSETGKDLNLGNADFYLECKAKVSNPNHESLSGFIRLSRPHYQSLYIRLDSNTQPKREFYLGYEIPNRELVSPYRLPTVPLLLEGEEEVEITIRFRGKFLPDFSPVIYPATHSDILSNSTDTIIILVFGIALAILLLNLFIWIKLRSRESLFYSIWIGMITTHQLANSGFGGFWIWDGIKDWTPYIMLISAYTGGFFLVCLTEVFLELGKKTWMGRGSKFFQILNLVFLPFLFFVKLDILFRFATFVVTGTILFCFWVSVRSYWRGFVAARFYSLSFFFILAGVLVLSFRTLGILPNNWVTYNAYYIASALDYLFITLAIVDKFNIIRRENIRFQHELAALNINLEDQVRLRTAELEIEKKIVEEIGSKLSQRNNNLERDLSLAREVQSSLLPNQYPSVEYLSIASKVLPMDEVGGDFFGFLEIPNNKIGIYIADVSGHGIASALLASVANFHLLNQSKLDSSPAKILQELNRTLYGRTKSHFITMFVGVIDKDLQFQYSNAGHCPPFLIRAKTKECHQLYQKGLMLGPFPKYDWIDESIQLQSGDFLLFYTDGIIEAKNAKEEMFGEDRLKQILLANYEKSNEEILQEVQSAIFSFTKRKELEDDFTILTLRVR